MERNKLSFSERFKSSIRFFASLFASREFAVLYCIIGTIAEIAHMYYLTYSISALSGWFKVAQAVMLSAFISSSLLYFVLISDDRDTSNGDELVRMRIQKDSKRINLAINIFTFINIAINFYYYCRHLIIDSTEWQMFDFIFAILVSCLLPVTIKLYANGIHVKDWVQDDSKQTEFSELGIQGVLGPQKIDIDVIKQEITSEVFKDSHEYITGTVSEIINRKLDELKLPNKEQIRIAFEEHSQLFLKQFENKLKVLSDKIVKPVINEKNISMDSVSDTNNIIDSDSDSNITDTDIIHPLGDNQVSNELSEVQEVGDNESPILNESNTTEPESSVGLSVEEYLKTLN